MNTIFYLSCKLTIDVYGRIVEAQAGLPAGRGVGGPPVGGEAVPGAPAQPARILSVPRLHLPP